MTGVRFSYNVYLPTLKKYARFYEFTGDHYLTIAKHIQNNDDTRVLELFQQMISELCLDPTTLDNMTKIDMFCVLLNMRILCVSDKMEMMLRSDDEEQHPQKIVFDLYDILDKVTNYDVKYTQNIKTSPECSVKLSTPQQFITTDTDELIMSVLECLYMFGKQYNFKNLSTKQQKIALDNMPGNILTDITRAVNKIDEKYSICVLNRDQFKLATEGDVMDFNLRMYDNSFYEFLKLIYGCNLEEQYYVRYLMVKQMRFNLDDVAKHPPYVTNTYINLYRKELDEQKKQSEKNNQSTGGMSLPQHNFTQ